MKKTTLALSLLLVFFADSPFVIATAQVWDNTRYVVSTVKTGDSGYAMLVINNYSMYSLDRNYSLVKIDAFGRQEWNKTYTLNRNDGFSCLVYTSDGGYALAGGKDFSTYGEKPSLNGRGIDFWLVKTDGFGNIEWERTYGGSWHESVGSVIETSDGGYALAGYTSSYGDGLWLVKTDTNGTLQWQHWYMGDSIKDIVQTDDNGFAFITRSGRLIKTDNDGTVEWSVYVESSSQPNWMLQTSDKGFAILCCVYTGYFETVYHSLTKVDVNGSILWKQKYTTLGVNSFAEVSNGGFVLAGYNSSLPWIAKTNATGNLIWNRALGNYTGSISSIIETNHGDFFVVGISDCSLWTAKTDANGNIRISSPEPDTPSAYPLPMTLITAILAMLGVSLFVYFRKYHNKHLDK
jgi:hypothetical protein